MPPFQVPGRNEKNYTPISKRQKYRGLGSGLTNQKVFGPGGTHEIRFRPEREGRGGGGPTVETQKTRTSTQEEESTAGIAVSGFGMDKKRLWHVLVAKKNAQRKKGKPHNYVLKQKKQKELI